MSVTIEDVAKAANVSIATVSRVINGTKAVSPETEMRVLKAINAMQFKPNHFARGLSSNQSDMIGVIVTDIANWVIAAVIKGINSVCQERGYTLMVSESGGNPDREKELLRHLEEQKAAGVLFAGLNVTEEITDRMMETEYPVVLVTQESTDGKHRLNTVIHDNVSATVDAVKFLMIIFRWQMQPVAEVGPGPRSVAQLAVSCVDHRLHFAQFVFVHELLQCTGVK